MRQQVVVLGLWGWSGREDGGRSGRCGPIRSTLAPLGVPGNQVCSMSWHPGRDQTNASVAPDTDAHLEAIHARTDTPSYVAIMGHGDGGWAACTLARALARRPPSVALIDAVFAPGPGRINPSGDCMHNGYQEVAVFAPAHCTAVGKWLFTDGLACGQRFEHADVENEPLRVVKDWNGRTEIVNCFGFRKPKLGWHVMMASHNHLWMSAVS
jgi:hypothetical protein